MPADDPKPASARFDHPVRAEPADIDGLGHVSNLVYLRWVLEAAGAHSDAVGWTLPRYLEAGFVFVVRKHEITYLRPVLLGETLTVVTWVDAFTAATSLRHAEIVRDGDADVVARSITTWALVDTERGRPLRIPDEVLDDFAA